MAIRKTSIERVFGKQSNRIKRVFRTPVGPFLLCCIVGMTASAYAQTIDYTEPKLLVGKILDSDTHPNKLLFKSERKSTTNGNNVEVICDYTYPDGVLAVRDRFVYQAGQLLSYNEEELQTGEKGSAVIRRDKNGKQRLWFDYSTGQGSQAKTSSDNEELERDTLVDDMIPAFLVSHWSMLVQGTAAKFRYVVLSRKETVGFKLVKDSELNWHEVPAFLIKMEPTSFIIAKLVDPLLFVVEKNSPHRILQYAGRMTPLVKNGNKWKDLDAVCVFEWDHEMAATGAGLSVQPGERINPH